MKHLRLTAALTLSLLASVSAAAQSIPIPSPNLEGVEPSVRNHLEAIQSALDETILDPQRSSDERAAAYGDLGRSYHAYGLWAPAIAAYSNAVLLQPTEYDWHHLLGLVHRDAGQLDESIRSFRSALDLQPGRVAPSIYLGQAFLELDRVGDAQLLFEDALGGAPGSAAALAGLGDVALASGDAAAAAEHYREALASQPEATRLHYSLGLALRELGHLEGAREELSKAGTVGPAPHDPLLASVIASRTGERVFLLQGRRAYSAGQYDQAVIAFERAVAADSQSVRALVNLAASLSAVGDTDGARARLEQALALDSENQTARHNLGVLLAHANELEAAVEQFKAAVEADPGDEASWLELARIFVEVGQYAEARQLLEAGLDGSPTSGQLAYALGRILAACPDHRLRDGDRALDLAQRVFAAQPTVSHAALVASALAESGRCSDAATWQRRSVDAAREQGAAEALVEGLETELSRYDAGPSCRPPGDTTVSDD